MKKDSKNYFGGSSTVYALKLEIMNAIWNTIGLQLRDSLENSDSPFDTNKYYEFNRKLSDTLDKFIGIVGATVTTQREHREPLDYIYSKLSRAIVDEVFESDFVVVRDFGSVYKREQIFEVQIPFLKCLNEPTPAEGGSDEK